MQIKAEDKKEKLNTPTTPQSFVKIPAKYSFYVQQEMAKGVTLGEALEKAKILDQGNETLEKRDITAVEKDIARGTLSWKGSIGLALAFVSVFKDTIIFLPLALIFLFIARFEDKQDILYKLGIGFVICAVLTCSIQLLDAQGLLPAWLWFYETY